MKRLCVSFGLLLTILYLKTKKGDDLLALLNEKEIWYNGRKLSVHLTPSGAPGSLVGRSRCFCVRRRRAGLTLLARVSRNARQMAHGVPEAEGGAEGEMRQVDAWRRGKEAASRPHWKRRSSSTNHVMLVLKLAIFSCIMVLLNVSQRICTEERTSSIAEKGTGF
jgi:hypothetical protein